MRSLPGGTLKAGRAGRSLKDAAEFLNITHATCRTRLARIMAKTGTNRQTELHALVLRSRIRRQMGENRLWHANACLAQTVVAAHPTKRHNENRLSL